MRDTYWLRVARAGGCKDKRQAVALKLWLGRDVPVNGHEFPIGRPLRKVAEELARLGYLNDKGTPYHPQHLKEVVYNGLARSAVWLVRERVADYDAAVGRAYAELLKWGRFKRSYQQDEETKHRWDGIKKPGVKTE